MKIEKNKYKIIPLHVFKIDRIELPTRNKKIKKMNKSFYKPVSRLL
jgi:hypothetical protein